MALAYIGVGSNLQNPLQQVRQALQELQQLPQTELKKVSRLYQSAAIGPEQDDFINAAALLDTDLTPLELLDALQAVEQSHQRQRIQHWGPRTLDLDMLLYDQQIIQSARLTIPHAFLTRRAFVLLPLLDINPDLQLPDGSYIKDYLAACADQVIQPLNLHAQPEISQ
jgi:2-amino-4-hydroxy-6-hydroxymethyldihydropteridine diphosphokinase